MLLTLQAIDNRHAFRAALVEEYKVLFETDSAYAAVKEKNLPLDLARRMIDGLSLGRGDKEGKGVQRAIKALGIANSYRAIASYLNGGG